jgi:hypothetical protein
MGSTVSRFFSLRGSIFLQTTGGQQEGPSLRRNTTLPYPGHAAPVSISRIIRVGFPFQVLVLCLFLLELVCDVG